MCELQEFMLISDFIFIFSAQAASLEPALLELAGGSGSSFSDKILTKIKDTLMKVIDFANMYTENTLKRYALKAIRCSTYASQIKALRQELMECYAILNIAMGVDEKVQREQDIEDLKKEFNGLAMDIMGQISCSGNDAEERFNKLQEELRSSEDLLKRILAQLGQIIED